MTRARSALAALMLAACATVQTTEPGVVGVERKQSMSPLVTEARMNQGAADAYARILADAGAKGTLNRDPVVLQRVRGIAQRLIRQTMIFRPAARDWSWAVNVLTENDVNAWCMPGGKIAVYTGLLDRLRLTDDEVGAVIGHEIAHALREHGRERASQALAEGLLIGVIGAAVGAGERSLDLAQLALDVTFTLPNSREQETEADRIGVELAARAGFDPRAATTLWRKMAAIGSGAPPQWLSTHPANEARQQDVGVYAEKVMPLYRAAAKR